jgi:hypothetical protein
MAWDSRRIFSLHYDNDNDNDNDNVNDIVDVIHDNANQGQ